MAENTAQPKRRIGLLIWLVVSQLLAVASLWLWLVMAGSVAMGFDTGDALTVWITLISVCAYPLFPLIMAIGAWVAYVLHKDRLAAILTGLTHRAAGSGHRLAHAVIWIEHPALSG